MLLFYEASYLPWYLEPYQLRQYIPVLIQFDCALSYFKSGSLIYCYSYLMSQKVNLKTSIQHFEVLILQLLTLVEIDVYPTNHFTRRYHHLIS